MSGKLSKEQFLELYVKLPADLKDAVFAPETGENIEAICERNRIPEAMDFMISGIGDIYLGLLPPADFFAALEKKLEGKSGFNQIVTEINNFLLYRYKDSLEKLYAAKPAPEIPAAPRPQANAAESGADGGGQIPPAAPAI